MPLSQEAQDTEVAKRKVDFAIVCKPTDAWTNKICKQSSPSTSLNHTELEAIVERPIAVNIETKSHREGTEDAKRQLAIWVQAQFVHLRNLFGSVPDVLPLCVATGDKWFFLAAKQDLMHDASCTTVWGEEMIGDSSTHAGALRIVYALRLMYAWAGQVHKAWWDEQVERRS